MLPKDKPVSLWLKTKVIAALCIYGFNTGFQNPLTTTVLNHWLHVGNLLGRFLNF